MKKLLQYINSKANRRTEFEQSEEYRFFLENRHYLTRMPRFTFLYDPGMEPFNVMRANVVLYGYVNKITMESEIDNLKSYINTNNKNNHQNFIKSFHEIISEQPYYQEEKMKIYIPFFTRSLNQVYFDEPEKLLTSPYAGLKDRFQDKSPRISSAFVIFVRNASRSSKVIALVKGIAFSTIAPFWISRRVLSLRSRTRSRAWASS